MNYLIALLAFSAVMIILATLVTVLVEGIHSVLRKRSHDFDEMLTQLYHKSIRPQLKSTGIDLSKDAASFVRQIRENPAIGQRKGFFSQFIVRTEFEKLTTRQFVEQFAQTEAGQKLLLKIKQQEQGLIADTISNLSYQFERYGQGASEYFQRRAAFFSLLVAFVLAITLNIDAIRLYGTLAKDTSLSNQLIQQLDIEKLNKIEANALLHAVNNADKNTIVQSYRSMKENYLSISATLNHADLPIGHNFFPYCASSTMDSRCQSTTIDKAHKVHVWSPIDPLLSWFYHLSKGVVLVVSSQDGWIWLFRIILTTGMIGLGAPFWYKTYRFVGQFVPGRKNAVVDSMEERRGTSAPVTQSQPIQIKVVDTASKPTTGIVTRSLSPAHVDTAPVGETELTTQATQIVQPVLKQGEVGLLKGDLFNILKNTPVMSQNSD